MRPEPVAIQIFQTLKHGPGNLQPVNPPMHGGNITSTTTPKTCIRRKPMEDYETVRHVLTIVGTVVGFGVCILFAIDK